MANNPGTNAFLLDVYSAAQKRLREMILHPTGTLSGAAFNQARAAMQLAQVDKLVGELNAAADLWAGTQMPLQMKAGIAEGRRQMADIGIRPKGSPLAGNFNLVNRRAVEVLARDAAGDLRKANGSLANRAKGLLRQTSQLSLGESDINKILAGGIIDGKPAATIRALKVEFERVNNGQLVEVGGRNFEAKYYASIVVRTKTREAVEVARHEELLANDVTLVAIVGALSKISARRFSARSFPWMASIPSIRRCRPSPAAGRRSIPTAASPPAPSSRPWLPNASCHAVKVCPTPRS